MHYGLPVSDVHNKWLHFLKSVAISNGSDYRVSHDDKSYATADTESVGHSRHCVVEKKDRHVQRMQCDSTKKKRSARATRAV